MEPKKRFNVPKEVYLLMQERANSLGISVDDALVRFIGEHVRGGSLDLNSKKSPSTLWELFEGYASLDARQKKLFDSGAEELKQYSGQEHKVLERLKSRWDN